LIGWWQANSLGLNNGAAVSSWNDLSGFGTTLVPKATAPVFATSVSNGGKSFSAVTFNGSTDQLQSTQSPGFPQPVTFYVVAKQAAASSSPQTFCGSTGNGLAAYISGSQNLCGYAGYYPLAIQGPSINSVTAWHVYEVTVFGSSTVCRVDGGTPGISSNVGNNSLLMTGFEIGNQTFNGQIAEVLVYLGQPSATDALAIRTHLYNLYGVTGS
jgi:hypothetical protein